MARNEFQESRTPKIQSISSCITPTAPASFSWLDLPEGVTELFLERLPLVDYIRFESVCHKWQTIQKEHRVRHSPFQPPMQKSLPWLLPRNWSTNLPVPEHHPDTFKYHSFKYHYSLEDSKFYRRDFPDGIASSEFNSIFPTLHGWLFVVNAQHPNHHVPVILLNPLTGSQIQLPPLPPTLCSDWTECVGALSCQPMDIECIALILDEDDCTFHLCRVSEKQSEWTSLSFSPNDNFFVNGVAGAVYSNGKFYCTLSTNPGKLFVIDPVFPAPSVLILSVDCSQLSFEEKYVNYFLVGSNGKVLLVVKFHGIRFQVFSLCKNMWVKMENIGDNVLFVGCDISLSMLASDVNCKSNCIYYYQEYEESYWIFDMDTMLWTEVPPFSYTNTTFYPDVFLFSWFMPSLDLVSHA